MTDDEVKELAEDFALSCADENVDGVLVVSIFKNGSSRFCVAGTDKGALSESAAWAAKMLYEEIDTRFAEAISPSSLLH